MKGKKKKKHLHTNYIRTKYINPLSTTSQTKKKKKKKTIFLIKEKWVEMMIKLASLLGRYYSSILSAKSRSTSRRTSEL